MSAVKSNKSKDSNESNMLYPWLNIDRKTFLCMEPCSIGRDFVLKQHGGDMFKAWCNIDDRADYMIWLMQHCPGSVSAEQARHIAYEFTVRHIGEYFAIAKEYPIVAKVCTLDKESGEYHEWLPNSEQAASFVDKAFSTLTNYQAPTTSYEEYSKLIEETDCAYHTGGWQDVSPNGLLVTRTEYKNARRAIGILRAAIRLYRSLSCDTTPNDCLPTQSPEHYIHNITDQIIDASYIVGHVAEPAHQREWCNMIRGIVTPLIAQNRKLFSQHDEESE